MIEIRFDGPPGATTGRFVEVERDGKSCSVGEWVQDGSDWLLLLPDPEVSRARAILFGSFVGGLLVYLLGRLS